MVATRLRPGRASGTSSPGEPPRSATGGSASSSSPLGDSAPLKLFFGCCLAMAISLAAYHALAHRRCGGDADRGAAAGGTSGTAVLYSYYEKDAGQEANFDFFLTVAMGVGTPKGHDTAVDYVVVVGSACSPCARLDPLLGPIDAPLPGAAWISGSDNFFLLRKASNEGMDFGAHNLSLSFLAAQRRVYKYYMLLNSSVRGPFLPSYLPPGFHWTGAFTSRLVGDVRAVGASLVCLPPIDAGGFGPRLESWAVALDSVGMELVVQAGVFAIRDEKFGGEGVIVRGEYGMSIALLGAGHNIATLLLKYAPGVDWRDPSSWHCNDNVHPSRHGTYDGISMHPLETVFVKASWHVGEPFAGKYVAWAVQRAGGGDGTRGEFNEAMYRYAISPEAVGEHPRVYQAYEVGPRG